MDARAEVVIRPAEVADLAVIARVHVRAFDGFLREYYHLTLHDGGSLVVAESESQVTGFASGFRRPAASYERLSPSKLRLGRRSSVRGSAA
ncbi:MAG: hypothetical protein GX134_11480 [candidate division WS1 bacterium]|jgi:hypothetical protein|nr:hypothetical protein [candidate division WS1 bacterium]